MATPDNPISMSNLSHADALDAIAKLVDQAGDAGDSVLIDEALVMADTFEVRGLQPDEQAALDYYRANAWAWRQRFNRVERAAAWDFEQPEVREQIFWLRRAMNSVAFESLHPIRRCQILTNLGNSLDTLGRFIEARRAWSAALTIEPNFWMARCNRGRALMHYAVALYDPGHHGVLALHAHRDLLDGLASLSTHGHFGDASLAEFYTASAERIAEVYNLDAIEAHHAPDGWDMGESDEERSYRHWCLRNVLFLNPLNDVETASVAANDILGLPDFATAIGEPPIITGMFNELKQAFVSARWLLWEGMHAERPHFSDRDVLLYNTLDYPAYGLAVEKVKLAFRMTYSILDKVAYFLNQYLALGMPEKRINFRTIWRDQDKGPVRPRFSTSENWPLRGLYWLSKDLFEEGMRDSTEPEARALADLRNHLEHKYVKVHELLLDAPAAHDMFHDTLAHSIRRTDLEHRTLRLMQLVRSALIYLVLGIHKEEQMRAKDQDGLVAPMTLHTIEDDWKR
ncbi:hypothetical protein DyAD56_03505 [Dyella sp. AD56]|uniref:LA2681 family HEPN domain-containing protein n=1 Tax=Dyella sp. AD56 TaxID=1528744 RepID=UPI000C838CA3|nr:LA2681 family HEPN domain-containing protein [Dyella sp. AD56]PMQ06536.1 hypothetical protein DyAD56_03505 [Dyella sp. AD56]